MSNRKWAVVLSSLTVATLALFECGCTQESALEDKQAAVTTTTKTATTTATGITASTEAPDTERLPEAYVAKLVKPARRYKIGVLFPMAGVPFWTNEAYGIMDQAQKSGVDIIWLSADGYQNVDKQIRQIEDLVAQKVDAIILGATSYSGTVRAVDNAVAHGVKVINHVTSTNSEKVSSRVMTDYDSIGRKQAVAMGKLLRGEGKIVMLSGPAGAEWALHSVAGFKAVLAQKYPKIQIVAERNCNPDRTAALRMMEDLLVTFPDLKGVFTVTDILALGASDAIVRAHRIEQIEITTAGFSQDSIDAMKRGWIDLNVDESPLLTGRVALNTAIDVLNGDTVHHTILVPNPVMSADQASEVEAKQHWAPSNWKLH